MCEAECCGELTLFGYRIWCNCCACSQPPIGFAEVIVLMVAGAILLALLVKVMNIEG